MVVEEEEEQTTKRCAEEEEEEEGGVMGRMGRRGSALNSAHDQESALFIALREPFPSVPLVSFSFQRVCTTTLQIPFVRSLSSQLTYRTIMTSATVDKEAWIAVQKKVPCWMPAGCVCGCVGVCSR